MRRPLTVLRALAAVVVLVAVVAGMPVLLAATVGNPWRSWPDLIAGDLSDTVLVAVLAAVAYLAWAQFAVAVIVELVAAALRRRRPVRLVGIFPAQQRLAHTLVAAVFALGSLASTPTLTHTLPDAAPTATVATAPVSLPSTRTPGASTAPMPPSYVITAGGPGTYWDLATVHLGAGERWGEIWDLNRGRRQGDGEVMTDPGMLRVGWTVLLPADAAASPSAGAGAAGVGEVVVEPGDTLSGIAAAHDVADWHRLWAANAGSAQPGGKQLTDPDHIEPGWVINVSATDETAAAAPTARRPRPVPEANGREPRTAATPPAPPANSAPSTTPTHPAAMPTPTLAASPSSPTAASRSVESAPPAATPGSPAVPTAASQAQPDAAQPEPAPDEVDGLAALVAAGLGSGFVGGMALLSMVKARRQQRRYRAPGRAAPPTPISAVATERAVRSASTRDITWLDEALRGLCRQLAGDPGGRLPDVMAVCLDATGVELVLAQPVRQTPGDWTARDGGNRWHLARDAATGFDPEHRGRYPAPYPGLVSVGCTPEGHTWLLDLEHIAALALTGDPQRCTDLARYLAAELSQNPWPELVYLTLAGLDDDLVALSPERIQIAQNPTEITRAVRDATRHVQGVHEVIDSIGLGVLPARLLNVAGDTWFPEILILATDAPQEAGLGELLTTLGQGVRTGQVVVVTGADAHRLGREWRLEVTADGHLHVPRLDLHLTAHRLTSTAGRELAALLGTAAALDDAPVPAAHGDRDWEQFADAHGGLRPELVTVTPVAASQNGGTRPDDVPHLGLAGAQATSSVLPSPTPTYVATAATTAAEVVALAPAVPEPVTRRVADADSALDADLAAWHDPTRAVPTVRVLGPVQVEAPGTLPAGKPRRAWNTEVVAYLATRGRALSAEQIAADLWPAASGVAGSGRLRQAISVVRTWLGQDPATGQPYLPPAAPGTDGRGGLYRVQGVLVDADLMARLRLRGTTRGADGITDLQAALDLVTGMPFDRQRPGGYTWLADTPLDSEYTAMIVDVAHLLAIHHLTTGKPGAAHAAASVAAQAAPYDDVPLLDLIAACDALGLAAEAELYVGRLLAGHDAQCMDDLPPRTAQLLAARNQPVHGDPRAQTH
ncbi:MAG: LysM peptidoglycan-binding domain-containing protein [Kineosporiaceae bacterium]|nr:LysM peptidoglycan-binding domain-containing protein [Kineosporiaceae bacterium]